MNLGAEQKKVVILICIVVFGGGAAYYLNLPDSPTVEPVSKTASSLSSTLPAASSKAPTTPANVVRPKKSARGGARDYKPTLKILPEDRPNYANVDPTLRTDLLAKVQGVGLEGGKRSLFQFSTAPAPTKLPEVAAIHPTARVYGPEPPPPPPAPYVPPPPPPPPPITLKFFGFAKPRPDGVKRAFFMDGEDIIVASEGELIKKRYRLVQIDTNSVIMEDTQFKNNRQTLPLQPEFAG